MSALPVLEQLQVIRFDYKAELDINDKPQIGVIAQEINDHYPEIIFFDEEKDRYLVYYDKLSHILLKGVQELSAKISALENVQQNTQQKLSQQQAQLDQVLQILNTSAQK